LGIVEIIVILVVALIVIPPENLPDVMRAAGKLLRELRLASNMVMRELGGALDQAPAPRDVPPINTMKPGPSATAANIAQSAAGADPARPVDARPTADASTTPETTPDRSTEPTRSANPAADSANASVESADTSTTPSTHS
jgi:sec-independent protein translocase protein TatB